MIFLANLFIGAKRPAFSTNPLADINNTKQTLTTTKNG